MEQSADQDDEKKAIDALKEKFHKETVTQLLETARESYGRDLGASEQKRLDKKLTTETEKKNQPALWGLPDPEQQAAGYF